MIEFDPTTQEPHIWTTKGHLPISSLENRPRWVVSKGGKAITFNDEWFLGDECVKHATHIYDTTTGVTATGSVGEVR